MSCKVNRVRPYNRSNEGVERVIYLEIKTRSLLVMQKVSS